MREQTSFQGKVPFKEQALLSLFSFFGELIRPPVTKILVLLVVSLLLALLLVKESVDSTSSIVLSAAVVLIFACLAAALQYGEMRFRYAKRTEEQLKVALRDTIMELQEQRMEQVSVPAVRIIYVEHDPPEDYDVQGEFVRMDNPGKTAIDMTNWLLHDEVGHQFTFPAFILQPGAYVRVWTKAGTDTATDLYWAEEQAVWSNTRGRAYLRDSTGALIDSYRYGQPSPS